MEWAEKHMKINMELVIFTDETRATLNGPDGWGRDWVQPVKNVIVVFVVNRAEEVK